MMNIIKKGLLSKEKPETILDLNNGQGTIHYNHNAKEVFVIEDEMGSITITEDPKLATGKMFQYDCVRVEFPKTADHIFSTLLTAKYPTNRENKLVNEYQSALLGILPDTAKKPYEDFLKDRLEIRKMVDADCNAADIPMD